MKNVLDSLTQGNVKKASSQFSVAIQDSSQSITLLMKVGQSFFRYKKFNEAKQAFNAILQIAPHGEAYYGLALVAQYKGLIDEAVYAFQEAIKLTPDISGAHQNLAKTLHERGDTLEALKTLSHAQSHFPDDTGYSFTQGQLAASCAPAWHLPMLADSQRNDQYQKAIMSQVSPGDHVIDIGTGSGILAMMAISAGAKHVYAIENNKLLAQLARDIIALNGFEGRISVIEKHSTKVVVGKDIPMKADVLITEIFDNALVGEGVLPTLSHAWENLLKPSAQVIPKKGIIYGALCNCPSLEQHQKISDVNGFDLSPMELLSHNFRYTDAEANFQATPGNEIMSEPFIVKSFDFQQAPDVNFSSNVTVKPIKNGRVNSVLIWFEIDLSEGNVFSTQITLASQHWRQVTQLLMEPRMISVGEKILLRTSYNRFFQFQLGS